jgi:poly-gamma-glutamate capsule biosynthesis protein CapA/YwtB (metallophosphatase superfamily)
MGICYYVNDVRSINISKNEQKSKVKKSTYFLSIFLALLITFLYLLITDKALTVNAVEFLFSSKREIKYETFDLYLDSIGQAYEEEIKGSLEKVQFNEKKRFNFVDNQKDADIVIQYGTGEKIIYSEYLLPVGHLYWIKDSVTSNELTNGEYTILLEENLYNLYSTFLTNSYENIDIQKAENLEQDIKDEDCGCVGLIKDSDLNKEYKLLKVDDKYYLDTFDAGIEISLTASLENNDIDIDFVTQIINTNLDFVNTNFNENSIAKVNMTGVTALARRVAQAMDLRNNYDYPAEKIAKFLSDADLTHISNEISFVEGCSTYSGLRFCSNPKAIAVLKAIGVDLIELTGNHNNDFGSRYNTQTIETYKEEGWGYFGGGLDSEDASDPYIAEIDGTKIAFLGYNYYDSVVSGNSNPLAGEDSAGANSYSDEKVKEDIESVRDNVDIVIVDFQYQECYSYPSSDVIYPKCYKPIGSQSTVFRKVVDYGADIVIGTQAHQPQTYEIYNDGLIFYGLGNLFFDQSRWIGTRQGMVLTHYFKDGDLIQTKITPTIYDSDLQTEIADPDDAQLLLQLLSTARESL